VEKFDDQEAGYWNFIQQQRRENRAVLYGISKSASNNSEQADNLVSYK
jgi:hypothetical protein